MKTIAAEDAEIERNAREGAVIGGDGWPRARLGDCVTKIGSGFTPRGGHAAYVESGIPLIRSQNIHMRRFDPSGLAHISATQDAEMVLSRVERGDVLLNITGASIGRVCVVPDDVVPANVNQHVCIIRTDGTWLPAFLCCFLSTPDFQRFILGDQAGATRQALTKAQIEDFEIPRPSLPEQERIAGRLTKQLSGVERARVAAQSRLAAAEALPAAYLREVFEGEDAGGWETRTLGELCEFKNGLNFRIGEAGHALKIIGVGDFQDHLHAPIPSLKKVHLDEPLDDDYLVKPDDIVFVRSNGNPDLVGRSVIIPPTDERVTFTGFSIRARVRSARAVPIYLARFFKSPRFAALIKQAGRGANIRNISQGVLDELRIPLPPTLADQRRIAAELSERLAAAERLAEKLRGELAAIESLPAALLREAFGGGAGDE